MVGRRSIRNSSKCTELIVNRIGPEFESGERLKGVKSEQCLSFIIARKRFTWQEEKSKENYLWRNSFIPVGFEIEMSDTGVGTRVCGRNEHCR